jgi:hypothetical protein
VVPAGSTTPSPPILNNVLCVVSTRGAFMLSSPEESAPDKSMVCNKNYNLPRAREKMERERNAAAAEEHFALSHLNTRCRYAPLPSTEYDHSGFKFVFYAITGPYCRVVRPALPRSINTSHAPYEPN